MATVALVDDHVLLRKGLANLLEDHGHEVVFEASNGNQMIEELSRHPVPEVMLLDINMPVMDGYESAAWLKKHFPGIRVLALSMYDDEPPVLRMIKNGARGYVLKDCEPGTLLTAIHQLLGQGYYYSEMVSARLVHTLLQEVESSKELVAGIGLTQRELQFLKLVCSEMTYKEIADAMCCSPRTVDGYRDALFEKLDIRSRVGLVRFAIRNGIERA